MEALIERLRREADSPAESPAPAARTRLRRAILAIEPDKAANWAALASAAPESGRLALSRAVLLGPDDFRLHFNLANQATRRGDRSEAWRSLRRALLLVPDFARALANAALLSRARTDRLALSRRAWCAGGPAVGAEIAALAAEGLIETGHAVRAAEILAHLLRVAPRDAELWRLTALAAERAGDSRRSDSAYRRALILGPESRHAYIGHAAHLTERRRFGEAHRRLREALVLRAGDPAIWSNLAATLEREGRPAEALPIFRRLAVRQPGEAERYYNAGVALRVLGRAEEALAQFRRACLIAPARREMRYNLALCLLATRRYAEGFAEYENRWFAPPGVRSVVRELGPRPSFDLPVWRGRSGEARHVLLWGEQGIGDEIWGLGFLTRLDGRPERFTVEVDPRLVAMLSRRFPAVRFLPRDLSRGPDLGGIDAQLSLLSLPHVLGENGLSAPSAWLTTNRGRRESMRRRFTRNGETRAIAIAWRSVKPAAYRSFEAPLACWRPLAALPATTFVPLQYQVTAAERASLAEIFGTSRIVFPEFDTRDDLEALADAVAAVDRVVSIATALVPLAVAVGTPATALLKPDQEDWRYTPGDPGGAFLPGVDFLWQNDDGGWPALLRRCARQLGAP